MIKLRNILTALVMATASGAALAAEHEVKMLNGGADGSMVFEPGFIKVAPGDSVKFVATNPGHDSVSVSTPAGAKGWNSGMSKDITVKFDKEGVYIYKCSPHTVLAMVGVIQVGKATNLADAKKSAEQLSAMFAMNKDRLESYMAQVK